VLQVLGPRNVKALVVRPQLCPPDGYEQRQEPSLKQSL
jgi:hypothetical protein